MDSLVLRLQVTSRKSNFGVTATRHNIPNLPDFCKSILSIVLCVEQLRNQKLTSHKSKMQ